MNNKANGGEPEDPDPPGCVEGEPEPDVERETYRERKKRIDFRYLTETQLAGEDPD